MADDLFTPTIQAPPSTARPWRVTSLVYPSFFGGPLAAAVLGAVNGRRLGLRPGWLFLLAGAGLLAEVGRLLADDLARTLLWRSAAGVAVWGLIALLQRHRLRAFELRGGDPAPLLWPGLAAAVAGLVVDSVLVVLVRS